MIAMALAANPRLLVADEPTTALDVTVQGQVLSLIRQLQRTMDLSLLLITHDLGVIAHMVDYVYVMYLGRIVEEGPVTDIFDSPAHPYTRDLLRSIPTFSRSRSALLPISGSVPDAANTPAGCPFHPRCGSFIDGKCSTSMPIPTSVGENHSVRCFLYTDQTEEQDA